MFDVPNEVWWHYILALGQGDQFLCRDCFEFIAELIDGGAFAREKGGAVWIGTPEYRARHPFPRPAEPDRNEE
jgi:hypothetical protein